MLFASYKKCDNCIKYGYVDEYNNVVIPYMYEFAYPFSCSLAGVRDIKTHLVGFVDESNNKVIDYKYEYIHPFFDNYAWVRACGLWGVIDIDGNQVIPCKYLRVCGYKNGVTIVQNKDSKWGVIDIDDNIIIPFIYDYLGSYENNIFNAFVNNTWYKINIDNKICKSKVLVLDKNIKT